MRDKKISVSKVVTFTKKSYEWCELDIHDLGEIFDLSVRCVSALKNLGIFSLGKLLTFSEKELLSFKPLSGKKIGKKSMEEVHIMLGKLDMKFKSDQIKVFI